MCYQVFESLEILLAVNISKYPVAVLPTGAQVILTHSCHRLSQNVSSLKETISQKKKKKEN